MNALLRATAVLATSALLHGCASPPPKDGAPSVPQDEVPAPVIVLPPEPTPYELNQIERAQLLARQGKLAEAALVWEMLMTIRPGVAQYQNRHSELQRQMSVAANDRIQKAEQAAGRGQIEAATQHYLAALALQPADARVADALRSLERERVKRSHLGKLSRNTLTRRAMSEGEMGGELDPAPVSMRPSEASPAAKAPQVGTQERNDLEHASLLSSQGEHDEAIKLLEKRLASNRRDDPARLLLSDVYYQKAETLVARNRPAAITLLERSLRADPGHPKALLKLRELRAETYAPAAPSTANPGLTPAAASTTRAISPAAASTPAASPVRR